MIKMFTCATPGEHPAYLSALNEKTLFVIYLMDTHLLMLGFLAEPRNAIGRGCRVCRVERRHGLREEGEQLGRCS